ncbi:MAG: DUF4276 family protein [Acidobacteriota bacterium]|nr:DUF4276 family protein [Acidobacteriota bacterium]
MRGVRLFVEGGGDTRGGSRALRTGFQGFLGEIREQARAKRIRWNLVMCGSRREAYESFLRETPSSDEFTVLLVDSEAKVSKAPRAHLAARPGDKWTSSHQALDDQVHLMVQTMETWLIADAEALGTYYGSHFNRNALPSRQNLEEVPKEEVSSALERATQKTQKGEYHKIRHASDLLALVGPEKVKERCRHCKRLFDTVTAAIEAA